MLQDYYNFWAGYQRGHKTNRPSFCMVNLAVLHYRYAWAVL